jgi:glycerate-2-kinase
MFLVTNTWGFDMAAPACVSDMITEMDINRFVTHSLRDPRILRILSATLDAVDPYMAVQKNLPEIEGRVFGLGIGKAAIPMMDALVERIPPVDGLAVTKFASDSSRAYTVMEGGHPVPDARSLQAGETVLKFVSSLQAVDTLVCLISGGGSALVTAPLVPLPDLQTLTSLLLASGARIDEINILRRQLDRVKGGGVARATKAKIISLILSDVVGNPLETIASGPTVPNPTTKADAIAVLKKYNLELQLPDSIKQILESDAELPESQEHTLMGIRVPGLHNVQNIIIGDNRLAAHAAWEQARREGFDVEILMNDLQGEAREAGVMLAKRLREESAGRRLRFVQPIALPVPAQPEVHRQAAKLVRVLRVGRARRVRDALRARLEEQHFERRVVEENQPMIGRVDGHRAAPTVPEGPVAGHVEAEPEVVRAAEQVVPEI